LDLKNGQKKISKLFATVFKTRYTIKTVAGFFFCSKTIIINTIFDI
jgi:hypothetical protein